MGARWWRVITEDPRENDFVRAATVRERRIPPLPDGLTFEYPRLESNQ